MSPEGWGVPTPHRGGFPGWAPADYKRRDLDVFSDADRAWLDRQWQLTGGPATIPDPWLAKTILR